MNPSAFLVVSRSWWKVRLRGCGSFVRCARGGRPRLFARYWTAAGARSPNLRPRLAALFIEHSTNSGNIFASFCMESATCAGAYSHLLRLCYGLLHPQTYATRRHSGTAKRLLQFLSAAGSFISFRYFRTNRFKTRAAFSSGWVAV